jgi:AcrR family transcriptional regulator|tara:strand:+ start:25421 stop:26056 length:636 start_codon:yes stop_codon:yes gene_type:complete
MAQKDTVERILDAAEALFSEKGFAETSLRNITTKAGVNLAAVNYHFGSKKSLIQAVFARYLTPFSHQFSDQLDVIELQHNTPEQLLKLLVITLAKSGLEKPEKFGVFMRLLGLAYSQGQGHLRKFLTSEYGEVFARYMKEVNRITPELSPKERFWRIHFMLGAAVFTMSSVDSLVAMENHDLGTQSDVKDVISQLMPFLASGLMAVDNDAN